MTARKKTAGPPTGHRTTTTRRLVQAQSRPPIDTMTPQELRAWISATRTTLQQKMARERAYLDRRAARGTYTPTDQAYEADQFLEADLLALLDEFEQHVAGMERDEGAG
jgi:hypothetical protein